MTLFVEATVQTLTVSGLPKIKRDFELTFDEILKNLAFAPKKYLFPVTANMFIVLWKPFFFVLKIPLMAKRLL